MEVDKARRNDKVPGVDGLLSGNAGGREDGDLSSANSDVANPVKIRRGIHHVTAEDDDVVCLGCGRLRLGSERVVREGSKRDQCEQYAHVPVS